MSQISALCLLSKLQVAMAYLKRVVVLAALFLLTSLLCWLSITALPNSPLCGVGLFVGGVGAVVLTIDAIDLRLSSSKVRR